MAKQQNRHFLADRGDLVHLLPSIKLMIIARKKSHIQDNHTTNRVSQSKTVHQIDTYHHPIQAFHISPKHVLTSQTIHQTLTRLIPIRIVWSDSADACTRGGYLCSPPSYVLQVLRRINPPHTRLALNEFQASCYSHHRSQSALSETN